MPLDHAPAGRPPRPLPGRSTTSMSNWSSIRLPAADATRRTAWPGSDTDPSRPGPRRAAGRQLVGPGLPSRPRAARRRTGCRRSAPWSDRRRPRRHTAELVLDELAAWRPGPAVKVDPVHALASLELGESKPARAGARFIVANRRDQQHPLVAQLRTRKATRARVDGSAHSEILDHEHHGPERATRDDAEDQLEQPDLRDIARRPRLLRPRRSAHPGSPPRTGDRGPRGCRRASSARSGPSRAGSAPGSTPSNRTRNASTNGRTAGCPSRAAGSRRQDSAAGPFCIRHERVHEPRLADAGLAYDDHDEDSPATTRRRRH